MRTEQSRSVRNLSFTLILLGMIFLLSAPTYAQRTGRKRIPSGNPDDYIAKPGEKTAAEREAEAKARGNRRGETNNETNNEDSAGALKVQITAHPAIVRVGGRYTFVAVSKGGTRPYNYQWSGRNVETGNERTASTGGRSAISASFKNPGTSVITVQVTDDNGNTSQSSVKVRVKR